jgi:hypothetical protein
VYGQKRSLIVDDDHQVVLRLDNKAYKSYMRLFVPPLVFARQYLGNLAINLARFAQSDFHLPNEAGLFTLISSFYRSVADGAPLPIPYRQILMTSRVMDAALEHIKSKKQNQTLGLDTAATLPKAVGDGNAPMGARAHDSENPQPTPSTLR